jgi:hypothetical protein
MVQPPQQVPVEYQARGKTSTAEVIAPKKRKGKSMASRWYWLFTLQRLQQYAGPPWPFPGDTAHATVSAGRSFKSTSVDRQAILKPQRQRSLKLPTPVGINSVSDVVGDALLSRQVQGVLQTGCLGTAAALTHQRDVNAADGVNAWQADLAQLPRVSCQAGRE